MESARYLLPAVSVVPAELVARVRADFERFATSGLPRPLEPYLLDTYQLDVRSTYAGLAIANPWGKASGQLSMTLSQVEEDAAAGLGFVVLKTVIAQDAGGDRSMAAWAVPEARMVVEPIAGVRGERGWTVTWKGRGWWQPFDAYLDLVRRATAVGKSAGMLVVPSCKYHLPGPGETAWHVDEYRHTTRLLCEASTLDPLPIEKDFSPTLAGSDWSTQPGRILEWLGTVARLIRDGAPRPVRVGLKLFNAVFDDDFQLEMLRRVHVAGAGRPDFLVFCNRLFDAQREFEGHRGIAYGGPDLSDRNLRVLDRFRAAGPHLEMSATGNIHSGRMALEYALRGATSFQMHTLFQLPASEFALRTGSRTEKALHRLYFDPADGFIVWMQHLAGRYDLRDEAGTIQFRRLASAVRT